MKSKRWLSWAALAAAAAVLAAVWFLTSQGNGWTLNAEQRSTAAFPNKPITLVVPYAAGGGTDIMARALAKAAEKHLGQPVVVVNRTGGGGSIGLMEGSDAKADGYTVTCMVTELAILPHLGLLPITYEQFKPIAQINHDPSAITVRADAPWKTADEFLNYVKAHPGEVKMGNAGTGSIWHLAAATLEKESGLTFTHIPYEGAGPAVSALVSGFVDAVPVSPAEVKSYVQQGKLRTLAINDTVESEALPGVPTLKEATGLDVNFAGTWRGLAVPKGTPDDVTRVLTEAFMKAAEEPEFKEQMKANGLGLLVKDGEGFGRQLKESHDSFAELIPELGLSRK